MRLKNLCEASHLSKDPHLPAPQEGTCEFGDHVEFEFYEDFLRSRIRKHAFTGGLVQMMCCRIRGARANF